MAAALGRWWAGGSAAASRVVVGHSAAPRLPAWRLGLAAALALSLLLHLAGVWPIRAAPSGVSTAARQPAVLTRMIYVAATAAPAAPAPAAATEALPEAVQSPATDTASMMATPGRGERRVPVERAAQRSPNPPTTDGARFDRPTARADSAVTPVLPSTPVPVAAAVAPRAAPSLPDAPDYAMAATLNPPPRPISDIDPAYPASAGMRQGRVVLRLLIGETGHVDNVAVVRSSPAGVFDEAALTAFGQATFSPGRLAGIPVKSQWTVEVEFTPVNRGATGGDR